MVNPGTRERLNSDPELRRWGRMMDADILLEVGDRSWRWEVCDGKIVAAASGPFVMPSWTMALRADAAAWAIFMRREPTPGYHDLMALIRRGALRVEGDLRPFMQHLFWFKTVFARLREQGA